MQGPIEDRPEFDEDFAERLIGKYVLVGITIEDRRGNFKGQEQFHGIVVSASATAGISLMLRGVRDGEQQWLPPTADNFHSAGKGTYKLRSTN
jgi:hypothetical protein